MHKGARNLPPPHPGFDHLSWNRGERVSVDLSRQTWYRGWDLTYNPQIESLEARAREILELIPSLRNLLRPVNRLPPEALSRIAWFMGEYATDATPIIPLTHVCRYWRESIVSTPGSWRFISSESIPLTELSLERCQAAPLELWLTMDQVIKNPRFTAVITPYMQNTEILYVHSISTTGELAQALPDFPQSMPNLRKLVLSSDFVRTRQDVSTDPFGTSPLALTHLSLTYLPLYPSLRRLTTLTSLSLRNHRFDLHIDTLLGFLEANRALEHARLDVQLTRPAFRDPRREVGIVNKLQSLSICSTDAAESNALITRIPLQKGARLEINPRDQNAGLSEVLSGISVTHLSNLQSPTSMEYHPDRRSIQLLGPNGSFMFHGDPHFSEFPLFQLTNIKSFRLVRSLEPWEVQTPRVFPPLALRALETLVIEREVAIPHLLCALFADPSASPSLKTVVLLNCHLDEICMEALTKFVSDRKNTTSAPLHRVVIVSPGRNPSVASIDALVEHVPVVDVQMGNMLPADLF